MAVYEKVGMLPKELCAAQKARVHQGSLPADPRAKPHSEAANDDDMYVH